MKQQSTLGIHEMAQAINGQVCGPGTSVTAAQVELARLSGLLIIHSRFSQSTGEPETEFSGFFNEIFGSKALAPDGLFHLTALGVCGPKQDSAINDLGIIAALFQRPFKVPLRTFLLNSILDEPYCWVDADIPTGLFWLVGPGGAEVSRGLVLNMFEIPLYGPKKDSNHD